jgi:cytoskeleton protein RodZ
MTTTQHFDARSPGELLRKAREKQGLHIAALAAAIKVSPRKLEALEADRYDDLPDATFTRALAQTVCRSLKIDAKEVLALLPAAPSTVALVPPSSGQPTPFRDRSPRGVDMVRGGPGLLPLAAGAVLLLAAAAGIYFLPPSVWQRSPAAPTVASAPATAPALPTAASAVPLAAPSVADGASAAMPAQLAATDAAAMPSTAPSTAPGAGPTTTPAATPAVETVFAPSTAASDPVAPPAGLVQVRSSEATWIEARDGRGQLLLSRTVQPGEALGLDGSLPIRLTIGNAAATQVAFRGRPVDLAGRTRDNVARLELQ